MSGVHLAACWYTMTLVHGLDSSAQRLMGHPLAGQPHVTLHGQSRRRSRESPVTRPPPVSHLLPSQWAKQVTRPNQLGGWALPSCIPRRMDPKRREELQRLMQSSKMLIEKEESLAQVGVVVFNTCGTCYFCSVAQLCPTLWDSHGLQHSRISLSFTISQSLLKLMFIELVMPSNHLILCRPFLLLPSVFPSIRIFSNESALHIRWPEYWSFSFSISPSNEYSGLVSFRIDFFL